ncbi:MAG: hypothetical protein ED559_13490 [Phycisphaera sp.]|nr:MAG: hypothetical protein ED559_13490 [Phycisphaera sp.]
MTTYNIFTLCQRRAGRCALAAAALMTSAAVSQETDHEELVDDKPSTLSFFSDMKTTVSLSVLNGDADGRLVTPKGGDPGTTSPGRPTLEEIGITTVTAAEAEVLLTSGPHRFSTFATLLRLDGDDTLTSDLITHNVLFPSGLDVESEVKLDWYAFGYGYEFVIESENTDQKLTLVPSAHFVLFDFLYRLEGSNGSSIQRAYIKPGFQVGGEAVWDTGTPLSLKLSGQAGLPFDSTAEIWTIDAVALLRLSDNGSPSDWRVFAGVEYTTIDFEDTQPIPNDISVDLGPMVKVGVEVTF